MKNIHQIIEDLKNYEELITNKIYDGSLNGINSLKSKINELEEYIKNAKNSKKQKTIMISDDLHAKIKIYCAKNNIKINEWVEKILKDKINEIKD